MASNLKNAKEVQASNLKDLERQVRELAQAYGQTCAPMIRLKDRKARKPAGFEKWCNSIDIIDYVAPAHVETVPEGWQFIAADDISDAEMPA